MYAALNNLQKGKYIFEKKGIEKLPNTIGIQSITCGTKMFTTP